jgi:DNA-directed RNA polymerase specialized sigma subunit
MDMPYKSFSTVVGTCGGTVLATLPVIGSEDLIRTGILALIGAVVSFSVSFSLKIVVKNMFSAKMKSHVNFRKKKNQKNE